MEEQAIDRVHRIGQTKHVRVLRMCVTASRARAEPENHASALAAALAKVQALERGEPEEPPQTVEEGIIELQQLKRDLAATALGDGTRPAPLPTDDPPPVGRQLSNSDVLALFGVPAHPVAACSATVNTATVAADPTVS